MNVLDFKKMLVILNTSHTQFNSIYFFRLINKTNRLQNLQSSDSVIMKKTVVGHQSCLCCFFKPPYYGDVKVNGPKMEQNWAEEFWNLDGPTVAPLSLCIEARNTQPKRS